MPEVDTSVWLNSVATTIQEAPISPEQWDEVLVRITSRTGAQAGFFLGLGNGDCERGGVVARGILKAALRDRELIAFLDAATLSLGQGANFEMELRDLVNRPDGRSLTDLFGDRGLVWGVLIAREGHRRFALVLVHPGHNRVWSRPRDEVMLLLPYLQIAFKTHCAITRQRERAERMETIFLDAPMPLALVRPDLGVLLANRAFRALATDNPDLAISDGELELRDVSLATEIQGALAALASGRPEPRVAWVRQAGGARSWLVSVVPAGATGDGAVPFRAAVALPEGVALIRIREIGRNHSLNPDRVRAVLGLSATEANLACALANGDSSTEIAQARHVSKNTVHNQMASAMYRLGMHRQPQLLNLLSQLSSFI